MILNTQTRNQLLSYYKGIRNSMSKIGMGREVDKLISLLERENERRAQRHKRAKEARRFYYAKFR